MDANQAIEILASDDPTKADLLDAQQVLATGVTASDHQDLTNREPSDRCHVFGRELGRGAVVRKPSKICARIRGINSTAANVPPPSRTDQRQGKRRPLTPYFAATHPPTPPSPLLSCGEKRNARAAVRWPPPTVIAPPTHAAGGLAERLYTRFESGCTLEKTRSKQGRNNGRTTRKYGGVLGKNARNRAWSRQVDARASTGAPLPVGPQSIRLSEWTPWKMRHDRPTGGESARLAPRWT